VTARAASAPRAADACPRCGAAYEPDQEYCVECGLRLPRPTGSVAALGAAWRRRLGWYPGDWIWLAVALLLVAAAGATAAILATRPEPRETTFVATTTLGVTTTQTVLTTTAAAPARPPSTTSGTAAPPPPPPARSARGKLIEWPSSRSGWTIVLSSVPTTNGRAAALDDARAAVRKGLRAGVVASDDYSSLHPGYYVVFTGIFGSQDEAQAALAAAHSRGYPRAYVRPVSP
jgi:cell division septation protein DedD